MAEELKGEVFYLYAFDVADEIRTERITKILSKKAMPFGVELDHTLPKTIPFYRPLTINLRRGAWKLNGTQVQPVVRVYDVGVISIMISAPFMVGDLKSLMPLHHPVLDKQRPLDKAAYELCVDVVKNLREYMVGEIPKINIPEAYTVFSLWQIGEEKNVQSWTAANRAAIAGLLAETDPALLSPQQVDEIFRHCISYTLNDMTVIDWDAALTLDLSGPSLDVIHVLELANLQLEELVLMDRRLDSYLDEAYTTLETQRRFLGSLSRRHLAKFRRFRMDVAKITDEVSNISKFFGDWYLARIYLAARDRFHLSTWKESIQSRLTSLDTLYEVLRSETNEALMLVLEAMIVLLFIIDLIVVLLQK